MRKMFLIVLSLVIVSMFVVGCGTGQAGRLNPVEKLRPTKTSTIQQCPEKTIEATCADKTKILCTRLINETAGYENIPVLCSPGVCTGDTPNAKCSKPKM